MSQQDFKKKYLEQVHDLLVAAYENKGIQTTVSADKIEVNISIPRTTSDRALVSLLSQLYDVPT